MCATMAEVCCCFGQQSFAKMENSKKCPPKAISTLPVGISRRKQTTKTGGVREGRTELKAQKCWSDLGKTKR